MAGLRGDEALPLVLIPTTCGTGSEGNGFAVLTNPENGDKKSLRCNAIVAKVSIIDPECMMTMPKKVLASVAFDALCHNIEAYTSRIAQPFTDALSLYAIDLIAHNLVDVYNGTAGKEGWEKITLASTIGGIVINTAGVTLAHGMEHPASGLKNIVHGQGLAALFTSDGLFCVRADQPPRGNGRAGGNLPTAAYGTCFFMLPLL